MSQRWVEHAVIGEGRSAALVASDGTVEWLCWPAFDSPPLFAGLVEGERGGGFRLGPADPSHSEQRYHEDSNLLLTTFETAAGKLSLLDGMVVSSEDDRRKRLVPERQLLRRLVCERGSVEVELSFQPRAGWRERGAELRDAGLLGVRFLDAGGLFSLRGERPISLTDPLGLREDGGAVARFVLREGEVARFALSYDPEAPAVLPPLGAELDGALQRSNGWWRDWAARCSYQGPFVAEVRRSLLALKLLSFAPTGSIIALPEASPSEEQLARGGRSAWVRDASMITHALLQLGYPEDGFTFASWLLSSGGGGGGLELDGYGEIIDAVAQSARGGMPLDAEARERLLEYGHLVCRSWRSPDRGIWHAPRTALHTHSRALCWVALDRLLDLGQRNLLPGVPLRFADERERIRRDIESHGFSPTQVSYTHVLDGSLVDSCLMLLAWYGYASSRSPRMRGTFERIRERLTAGPALFYRSEDSARLGESPDGACSFWAAEHLARGAGTLEEAEAWFKRLLGQASGAGLYGEMIDVETGAPRGDFPQAFPHVGLAVAALAIEKRRRSGATSEGSGVRPLGGSL